MAEDCCDWKSLAGSEEEEESSPLEMDEVGLSGELAELAGGCLTEVGMGFWTLLKALIRGNAGLRSSGLGGWAAGVVGNVAVGK